MSRYWSNLGRQSLVSSSWKVSCENTNVACCSRQSTICAGADRGDSAALIRTLVSTTARSIFIGQELFQLAVGQTFGCDFFGILPQSALQSICIKQIGRASWREAVCQYV